jgi:hypothetical protein
MALCRAIRARAVALPAAVPAPGVAALFSADAATAGSAATAEGGVYRDRWFNGMHPPREWVHVGLGSAPGGGGAAAAAPISQDEERRRLTSMDLYGTLAQKHVCLSREQLLQMYADVSAIITMSRTTREAVCVFWGGGGGANCLAGVGAGARTNHAGHGWAGRAAAVGGVRWGRAFAQSHGVGPRSHRTLLRDHGCVRAHRPELCVVRRLGAPDVRAGVRNAAIDRLFIR